MANINNIETKGDFFVKRIKTKKLLKWNSYSSLPQVFQLLETVLLFPFAQIVPICTGQYGGQDTGDKETAVQNIQLETLAVLS